MTKFSEGDIFYTFYDDQYHLYKLLKADDFNIYHVLTYEPMDELPDAGELYDLEVRMYHSPISASGFAGPELLAKSTLFAGDMIGYCEYLRQTDDSSAELAEIANMFCDEAFQLTGLELYEEAIEYYSRAIELFPDFYDAIENRAFCKMDNNQWEEAIDDFRICLSVNPGNLPAVFSVGECLLHIGDYTNAIIQFEAAVEIDPTHQLSQDYLKKTMELRSGG